VQLSFYFMMSGGVSIKGWSCCWLGYCWQHLGSCLQVYT